MNQLEFALAEIARDLDRLGLPIEALWGAPLVLFTLLVILEKWRHRPREDALVRIERERYAKASKGSTGYGATILAGCVAGVAGLFVLDFFGLAVGG